MNDQRFFDLAMKVIARQANDAERADLDALLTREPELRAEFTRLEADARVAKDALPLVNAMRETKGELPVYARGRLQTMVRQTLGRPESAAEEPDRSLAWGWRWVLGLAAATAVVVIVAVSIFPHRSSDLVNVLPNAPNAPVIQLAMLDTVGGTRGMDTNELATLQGRGRKVQSNTFPAQGNWKRGRKTGAMAMDGLRLKSFTILQRERSEYLGVPEGSSSKRLSL